jgi:RNA polymerase sigma-70 factor (ECF subfamily)
VLFNSCRKQVRTLARRRKRDRGAARGEAFTPANDNSAVEEQERLRAALAELPEDQRQIVVLRFEQQFSVEETASALGIPQGTVKSRLHAALAKLRTLMGARHE